MIPGRCKLALSACLLGWVLPSLSQTPDLATLLARAADQAAALAGSLPSFSCARNGTSDILRASDNHLKKHSEFTGEVRALRHGTPARLDEQITYTSVNGKLNKKADGVVYDVHDSFTSALSYVAATRQHCFQYRVGTTGAAQMRVDFTSAEPFDPVCENLPGTEGYLLFGTDGNITHVERTVPERMANEADLAPFAAIDLAPVVLDGTTYRLVSRLISERQDGNELRHLDVRYMGCKLFHAKVTLLTGTETIDNGSTMESPAPAVPSKE